MENAQRTLKIVGERRLVEYYRLHVVVAVVWVVVVAVVASIWWHTDRPRGNKRVDL